MESTVFQRPRPTDQSAQAGKFERGGFWSAVAGDDHFQVSFPAYPICT